MGLFPKEKTAAKGENPPLLLKNVCSQDIAPQKDAFRLPILEALVELNGRADLGEVLKLVERKMRSRFTKYDFEPLPSDPNSVR